MAQSLAEPRGDDPNARPQFKGGADLSPKSQSPPALILTCLCVPHWTVAPSPALRFLAPELMPIAMYLLQDAWHLPRQSRIDCRWNMTSRISRLSRYRSGGCSSRGRRLMMPIEKEVSARCPPNC